MSTRDESRPVREEDAFDVEAVAAWLREHAPAYDLVGTPEVRQFPGGASNLTYLLRYPARDLILRRPPAGAKARSAHDMGREYDIQAALAPVFPYVATMVGLCRDEAVIGSEFYVMERLEGTIPRRRLGFEASPDDVADALRPRLGRARRPARRRRGGDPGAGGAQPRRGVRRAPGRRLDRPAGAGRDRRPRRLVAGHRAGSPRTSPPTSGSA